MRSGTLCASRWRKGRQAYIVYPVIEGTKDDQPELDFSHDEAQAANPATRPKSYSKRQNSGAVSQGCAGSGPNARNRVSSPPSKCTKSCAPVRFAGLRVGLLHGRLDADEKEIIMRRFQRGEIDVLVSTTVIEVGVDVPNATVMVVEHAERFGLAQLHQLRGRVGRGAAKSYCILMTGDRVSDSARSG